MEPEGSLPCSQKPSTGSSVGVVVALWVERSVFDSRQEQGIFLNFTASRPAVGPTQPLYSGYRGFLPWGV
jgi:hypothetical protein